jgi:hypothetical protein
MHQELRQSLLLGIIDGSPERDLVAACGRAGVEGRAAAAEIRRARRQIALAAQFDRAEEIGAAVGRLRQLYAVAVKAGEVSAALAAVKELNRLLDLYGPAADVQSRKAKGDSELSAIRAHLLPLRLASADYPLREHARLAAEIVRDYQGQMRGPAD